MDIQQLAEILGYNVRRLRDDRGWTQAELAERMSVDRDRRVHVPFVSDLERGTRKPKMETVARLSQVFDVTPNELLEVPEKFLAKAC